MPGAKHDGQGADTALQLARQAGRLVSIGMKRDGVSRVELARRIKRNPGNITHVLAGEHNYTLQSLAQITDALGYEVSVSVLRKGVPIRDTQEEDPLAVNAPMLLDPHYGLWAGCGVLNTRRVEDSKPKEDGNGA